MHQLFHTFWADDSGALEAIEFLLTAAILVLGLVVGLTTLRNAIAAEFAALANAILTLSVGYSYGGLSGCCSSVDGSQAIFIPGTVASPVCVPASSVGVITVTACP